MFRSVISLFVFGLSAAPSVAHEFWIEPTNYTIDRATTIEATLFNGQGFGGIVDGEEAGATRIGYFPNRIAATRYFLGDTSAPVDGRIGDNPAIALAPLDNGLHVVAYVSAPATIGYQEWEKFQNFVDHKDLPTSLAEHTALGFPEVDFTEIYIRNSKTLVAVGDGAGSDLRTGMETEIIALDNPYTDDVSQGMRVLLVYLDDIRANEQIELFEKGPDDVVTITTVRTNDDGIATLPVRPGFSYMADAVLLREPSAELAEQYDAVWETLWANLTFAVPAAQ